MSDDATEDERRNSGPNQEGYLAYIERYEDIEDTLVDAQETVRSIRKRRKDLRKTISADGYNLEAFDRALIDGKRSGEEREAEDRAYRQLMAWQRKPVGYQVDMFEEVPAGAAAVVARQKKLIDSDGYNAGREGHSATLNKWSPGTEEFAIWMSAWTRGQSEKVAEEIKPPEEAPKRGRGRPRKNAEDPALAEVTASGSAPQTAPHEEARRVGFENGFAGHRDNAARYPQGAYGGADYELGWADGERKREASAAEPAPSGEVLH